MSPWPPRPSWPSSARPPTPGSAGSGCPVTRQVNEVWLDRYRSWVYGAGFGWQIGVGLATYIVTAAVYLTIALAALTGEPATAFVILTGFGLGVASPFWCRARRPPSNGCRPCTAGSTWSAPPRVATIVAQVVLAAAAATAAYGVGAAMAVATVAVVVALVVLSQRRAVAAAPRTTAG